MSKVKLIAIAAVIGCSAGIWASNSLADVPDTLTLAPQGTPVVGRPFVIQASGTDSTAGVGGIPFSVFLDVDSFSPAVVSTCPSNVEASEELALSTGGSELAYLELEQEDASGNFSMPVGGTPSTPGPILICGYTSEAGYTLATATLRLTIAPAVSSGGGTSAKPPAKPHGKSPEATYKQAIASCDKLKGKHKATCVIKAKLALALADCQRVHGSKAHARCTARARRRYRVG